MYLKYLNDVSEVFSMTFSLRIDTGDGAWYGVLTVKMLF